VLLSILLIIKCVHPLILCLLLIVYSIFITIITGVLFSKWLSYAIILIFLGGIIIVFIYVTTLAGGDKFFTTLNLNPITVRIYIIIVMRFYGFTNIKKEYFILHIYHRNSPLLWFAIIFLLTTLFLVVKLAESFKGALIKFS